MSFKWFFYHVYGLQNSSFIHCHSLHWTLRVCILRYPRFCVLVIPSLALVFSVIGFNTGETHSFVVSEHQGSWLCMYPLLLKKVKNSQQLQINYSFFRMCAGHRTQALNKHRMIMMSNSFQVAAIGIFQPLTVFFKLQPSKSLVKTR